MNPTEISPERTELRNKPDRKEVRELDCYFCDSPIGNREFEASGKDVICGDCYYETGNNVG